MLSIFPIDKIENDRFSICCLLERLNEQILSKEQHINLFGIFGKWGTGKTSALNLCPIIEKNPEIQKMMDLKKTLWIPTFEAFRMQNAGNLQLTILWHIIKNISVSHSMDSDIFNTVKRISTALSIVGLKILQRMIGSYFRKANFIITFCRPTQ